MKEQLFDPSNSISIIEFLTTFNLVCDTSHNHERAAMWLLSFFFRKILATTLNSSISAAAHINMIVAPVRENDCRSK